MARHAVLKTVAGKAVGSSTLPPSASVINIKSAPEDWRSDPDYVYIGRGSKWGNPWIEGPITRREAIERYEKDLLAGDLLDDLEELCGKVLICHCAPLPCHGDVLVKWLKKR